MSLLACQKKRLRMGGVGPRLLTLAGHKGKRLHEGGVGPEMRSAAGFSLPRPLRGQNGKRPLRGVGPKILSSAGLVLRIMLPVAAPCQPGPFARLVEV